MTTTLERFQAKYQVDEYTGCWNWTASTDGKGYPKMTIKGKSWSAAKWNVTRLRGDPILDGFEPDHLCRNILCVNPNHLEVVTREENNRRRNAFYAAGNHYRCRIDRLVCDNGHPFEGNNLKDRSDGTRRCRQCLRDYQKIWMRSKRSRILAATSGDGTMVSNVS